VPDEYRGPTPEAPQPLWAPWRMEYLTRPKGEDCPLCDALHNDRLIVHRGKRAFVIMNLFPYSNGHVMVAPIEHVAQLSGLDAEVSAELMELTQRSMAALERTVQPEGFNIGYNIGHAAGAGITDHVHEHVVPRWSGDTNFLPVLAGRKTIGEAVEATLQKLLEVF